MYFDFQNLFQNCQETLTFLGKDSSILYRNEREKTTWNCGSILTAFILKNTNNMNN